MEDTDKQLYWLRNRLAELEYWRDLERGGMDRAIREVHATERRLLAEPQLGRDIERQGRRSAARGVGRAGCMSRRAELMGRLIDFSRIENDGRLRAALGRIGQEFSRLRFPETMATLMKSSDPHRRRRALVCMAGAGAALEPQCRDMVRLANAVAEQCGYAGYVEAKLSFEGLTGAEVGALFRRWRDRLMPVWREATSDATRRWGSEIPPHDLLYALNTGGRAQEAICRRSACDGVMIRLLERLGAPLEAWPVYISRAKIPFNGACYRVQPGRDVRILLSRALTGYAACFYLFHEFGHAAYYSHCPQGSEMLIDSQLSREIVAEIWTRFLQNAEFLSELTSLDSRRAEAVVAARARYDGCRLLLTIRDSMFTFEVFRDPERPWSDVWSQVTDEWLGQGDPSGAFDIYDMPNPMDTKNYAIAQAVATEWFEEALRRCGGRLSPLLLEAMVARLYHPGNLKDWQDKFTW